jgi:hypothetical protein
MAYEVVFAHGIWQVLTRAKNFIPHQIGVYGATESGKTTLDKQFTTKGEVRELGLLDRTHHEKQHFLSKEKVLPNATRKHIKSEGLERVLVSADIGGHVEYHSMWLRDMIKRKVSTVVIVVDHRHLLDSENLANQTAVGYLLTALSQKKKIKGLTVREKLRARKYAPRRIILLANKADEWLDEEGFELWQRGFIARHPIFDVFREDLYGFHEIHIPVYIDAISARSGWNVENAVLRGLSI